MIPTFDTCTYYDLWFTGMGGARVYAKYVVPATEGKHPLVHRTDLHHSEATAHS